MFPHTQLAAIHSRPECTCLPDGVTQCGAHAFNAGSNSRRLCCNHQARQTAPNISHATHTPCRLRALVHGLPHRDSCRLAEVIVEISAGEQGQIHRHWSLVAGKTPELRGGDACLVGRSDHRAGGPRRLAWHTSCGAVLARFRELPADPRKWGAHAAPGGGEAVGQAGCVQGVQITHAGSAPPVPVSTRMMAQQVITRIMLGCSQGKRSTHAHTVTMAKNTPVV